MPIRGRRNRRFVVEDATVEYRRHSSLPFLGGSPKISALINLSVGGMQFVSEDLFDSGQRLDLRVMLPSAVRALVIRGEVVWAKRIVDRDSYRIGVRFLQPGAEDVSLLRSLEEHYWSISDDRKRQMEALIAERFPLHREKPSAPAGPEAAAEEPAAPPPPAEPPPPPPPKPPAPEPKPTKAEPAPQPRVAVEAPPRHEPVEAPEPLDEAPEPEAMQLTPIPVFDLVTGIETQTDADHLLQGVAKYHVSLPGVTDRDCFAVEVHDNTMRHTGMPSFDRGDVVVFSPNVPARSGDLAFIMTREGGVFRQIFFDANNIVRIRPLNSWYPEQCFHRGEVQGLWKLVGKYESYKSK
jgi:SOS-response transcriptional repressor LexA